MFQRLRLPAPCFFVASAIGLLLLHRAIGGHGTYLSVAAVIHGFALGLLIQASFLERIPRSSIAVSSFLGAFLLWVPVVLVTYGLALMAIPIFVAYAASVVLGVHVATWHRARTQHSA